MEPMHPMTEAVKKLFKKHIGKKVVGVWTQSSSITTPGDPDRPERVAYENVVIDLQEDGGKIQSVYISISVGGDDAGLHGFGEYA